MIYFSYINIHWNYLLYEVVERAVPLILWYSRYILLCCSTENQYLSYNFYLFLPYNGRSNNDEDDNTILSNNMDAWDPVPIYMRSWAVRSTHHSFWCLRYAILIMSSRKKIQFLKFSLLLILMLGKHQNKLWVNLTIQQFILPLVILWVLGFGFWAIFPRTTTPYPSTIWVMFFLLTHFCISRSLSKSFQWII